VTVRASRRRLSDPLPAVLYEIADRHEVIVRVGNYRAAVRASRRAG
jgi:hypothetical protein